MGVRRQRRHLQPLPGGIQQRDLQRPRSLPAAQAPQPSAASLPSSSVAIDPAFGQGLSGVYLGLERGAKAGAGIGEPRTFVGDDLEVDVLFPNGLYRRRLPIRGLASDPAWEQTRQPALWGRWARDGDRVVVQRGSYTTVYTVDGKRLVSDRGRPWTKLSMPTNARLEGSYARADYRDASAPRLVLTADGRYEDRGGFLLVVNGRALLRD